MGRFPPAPLPALLLLVAAACSGSSGTESPASTGPPQAAFAGTPTAGTAPLDVDFADLSSGGVTSRSWDFGDGGSSSEANPVHTYATAGTYTVSLTVTGPDGSDTETKPGYVTVSPPPPEAAFAGAPTSGVAPLAVDFTDQSTGDVTSWSWDFGDGGSSTDPSPQHTYDVAGTYTVSLTVTGPGGSDTETKPDLVTVSPPPPEAAFTGAPTSGVVPFAVDFTDLSTGDVASWSWDFGDGGSATVPSPQHTYDAAGTYTVSLTVTGPGGSDTETKPDFVTADAPPPPEAAFSASASSGVAPFVVDFTDLSTGDVTEWSWDFGDGGAGSTDPSPSHAFVGAGTYTVSLTVTGPGGSDTETQDDVVRATVLDAADVLAYEATGTLRVLFVPASLVGAPAPVASEARLLAIRDVVAGTFDDNSGGALALDVDHVWPPVQIPRVPSDYTNATALVAIRADALAAAQARGFDPADYDREVIFAPDVWPGTGRGWMRTVWMPHDLEWVLVHELGHTLNWAHANLWDGDPQRPEDPAAGNEVNYGDLFDPMGTQQNWNRFRRFSPWYQLRAGWLADAEFVDVARDGVWTLTPLDGTGSASAPRALRIRDDAGHDYWIFHRREEDPVANGPLIVRSETNPFESQLLLDMHPETPGEAGVTDAALGVGELFQDLDSGTAITNVSPDNTAVVVDVQVDETRLAAMDRLPVIQVVDPPPDGNPLSGVVDFVVEVRDPDAGEADGAGIARVTLALRQPDDDAFPIVDSMELLAPPYVWTYDTGSLPISNYYLSITAESTDGAERTAWTRYLVE